MHKIIQIENGIVIGTAVVTSQIEVLKNNPTDIIYKTDISIKAQIGWFVQESESGIPAIRVGDEESVFLTITPNT